jgi:hypothetical protein
VVATNPGCRYFVRSLQSDVATELLEAILDQLAKALKRHVAPLLFALSDGSKVCDVGAANARASNLDWYICAMAVRRQSVLGCL